MVQAQLMNHEKNTMDVAIIQMTIYNSSLGLGLKQSKPSF